MTIEGILFTLLAFALLLNWPVAIILVWAAWHKPRIRALTVSAVLSTLIALALTAYVIAAANTTLGLIPTEIFRIILRIVFLGLAVYPIWWLYLYLTGGFRDGEQESNREDHG